MTTPAPIRPTYDASAPGGAGTAPDQPDLVVLSHLRWDWVWQRPQHLISRLSAARRTWFVEEPFADPAATAAHLTVEPRGAVTVVRLVVPGQARHIGFDTAEGEQLARALGACAAMWRTDPIVWLYTPLALHLADELPRRSLVFDVMDDLASFKDASPLLRRRHAAALSEADVVFTGGRSLHRSVCTQRSHEVYLFPSGVESEHYAPARSQRTASRPGGGAPVAGYVGVIDERIDLDLIADVATQLPGWRFEIVGPVAKIDPSTLPDLPNVHYPGPATYAELPAVMAGFDVALMPFARNEATRSISPTKTLEYLAAGLPVVSTTVADVVTDFGHVVELADRPGAFASACIASLGLADDPDFHRRCEPLLEWRHWDRIAGRMDAILHDAAGRTGSMERSA